MLHCTLELYKIFLCSIKNDFFNDTIIFITGRNEVVAKVMFLHVSVILLMGGVSPGRENPGPGRLPQTRQTPLDQADPPPPGPGRPTTPRTRQTPTSPTPPTRQTPPGLDPPRPGRHPPGSDTSIRLTSGRYASYWNTFLFLQKLTNTTRHRCPGIKHFYKILAHKQHLQEIYLE